MSKLLIALVVTMLVFTLLLQFTTPLGGFGLALWTVLLAVVMGAEVWYFRRRDAEDAGR